MEQLSPPSEVQRRWRLREIGDFLTRQILHEPPLAASNHYVPEHFQVDPEPKPEPDPVPDVEGRDI